MTQTLAPRRSGRIRSRFFIAALFAALFVALPLAGARGQLADPDGPGTAMPALSTDKEDYAPGETVEITGTNFAPGVAYSIIVIRPDGSIIRGDGGFSPDYTYTCFFEDPTVTECWDNVTAGPDGGFVYHYILNGIAGEYDVRAYESPWDGDRAAVPVASTTFTDGNLQTAVSPNVVTVTAGGPSAMVTVTSTIQGNTAPGWRFRVPTVFVITDGVCAPSTSSSDFATYEHPDASPFETVAAVTAAAGQAPGQFECTIQEDILNPGSGQGGALAASTAARLRVDVEVSANTAPACQHASGSTDEDAALNGSVSCTDVDGDSLSYSVVDDVNNGTLIFNSGGTFTYTPDADFNGSDSFTFKANDGLVDSNTATFDITVDPVNDAPVCNDGSDSTDEDTPLDGSVSCDDIDGDTLSHVLVSNAANGNVILNANGNFTFTPDADFNGSDSFTFKANDGEDDSNTATFDITVDPVNDAPMCQDDSGSLNEDTALNGTVSCDDVDGDALTYSLADDVSDGTLVFNPDGTFTYTPDADFNGPTASPSRPMTATWTATSPPSPSRSTR